MGGWLRLVAHARRRHGRRGQRLGRGARGVDPGSVNARNTRRRLSDELGLPRGRHVPRAAPTEQGVSASLRSVGLPRPRQDRALPPGPERRDGRLRLLEDAQRHGRLRVRLPVLHASGESSPDRQRQSDRPGGRLRAMPGEGHESGDPRRHPDAEGRRGGGPGAREPGPRGQAAGELAGRHQLSRHQHRLDTDLARGVAELFLHRPVPGERDSWRRVPRRAASAFTSRPGRRRRTRTRAARTARSASSPSRRTCMRTRLE